MGKQVRKFKPERHSQVDRMKRNGQRLLDWKDLHVAWAISESTRCSQIHGCPNRHQLRESWFQREIRNEAGKQYRKTSLVVGPEWQRNLTERTELTCEIKNHELMCGIFPRYLATFEWSIRLSLHYSLLRNYFSRTLLSRAQNLMWLDFEIIGSQWRR